MSSCKIFKRLALGPISTLALAAVLASPAVAQENPGAQDENDTAEATGQSQGLDAIIVTARRRAEDVQDTPVSVAAFGASDLEARGVEDLQGLNGFIPNVNLATTGSFGSTGAAFTIRGGGQDRNSVTLEPGVGLYVDGIYLGRSESSLLKFGDLERVEVLRGPQGTLFGKNSSGGAINIVTAKPDPYFGGEVEIAYGSFDRLDVTGRVNVPLSDTLYSKVTAFSTQRDGYVIRPDGVDVGDDNTQGARLQLRWEPTSDLTVDLSADYSDLDRNGVAFVALDIDPTALFPTLINQIDPGVNPPYDDRWVPNDPQSQTFGTGPTYHELESWGASAEVNWALGAVDFKSLTGYREYDLSIGLDGDGTPVRMFHQFATRDFYQFSQEFQLSGTAFDRLEWVAGAFYFTENPTEERRVEQRGIGNFGNMESFSYDQKTHSYAVYGQGTLEITDQLSATLGGRYSYDKKRLILSEPTRFPDVELVGRETFESFTPRIDIQYQWTDDIMTYASYAKGFKGGGINDRIVGVPGGGFTTLPFADETNDTYEAGIRTELFDRRLRFNATYFHTIYTDLQQAVITSDPAIPNRTLVLTQNIGQAKVDGVEVDATLRPFENLTLNASFGYLDTRITRLNAGTVGGLVIGGELLASPEYSYTIGGEYIIPLANGSDIGLRVDYAWKDEFIFATDLNSAVTNPATGLLSGQISYNADGWSLALVGTNLTDELYYQNGLDLTNPFGFVQAEAARPREWALRFTGSF